MSRVYEEGHLEADATRGKPFFSHYSGGDSAPASQSSSQSHSQISSQSTTASMDIEDDWRSLLSSEERKEAAEGSRDWPMHQDQDQESKMIAERERSKTTEYSISVLPSFPTFIPPSPDSDSASPLAGSADTSPVSFSRALRHPDSSKKLHKASSKEKLQEDAQFSTSTFMFPIISHQSGSKPPVWSEPATDDHIFSSAFQTDEMSISKVDQAKILRKAEERKREKERLEHIEKERLRVEKEREMRARTEREKAERQKALEQQERQRMQLVEQWKTLSSECVSIFQKGKIVIQKLINAQTKLGSFNENLQFVKWLNTQMLNTTWDHIRALLLQEFKTSFATFKTEIDTVLKEARGLYESSQRLKGHINYWGATISELLQPKQLEELITQSHPQSHQIQNLMDELGRRIMFLEDCKQQFSVPDSAAPAPGASSVQLTEEKYKQMKNHMYTEYQQFLKKQAEKEKRKELGSVTPPSPLVPMHLRSDHPSAFRPVANPIISSSAPSTPTTSFGPGTLHQTLSGERSGRRLGER